MQMQKYLVVAILLVLGLFLGSAGAQVNLLPNGGFEKGNNPPTGNFRTLFAGSHDISTWTVTNGSIDWMGSWTAAEGLRCLDLSGTGPGTVATTFATTPGVTYRVAFDLSGNFGPADYMKSLRVSAAGQSRDFSFPKPMGWSLTNMGWTKQTWTFKANAASTTLVFTSLMNNPGGPALDNVEVTPILVGRVTGTAIVKPPVSSLLAKAKSPIPKNVKLVSVVACLGIKKYPSGQPYCVGKGGNEIKGKNYKTFRLEDSIWILATFRNVPKGNYVLETKCSSSKYPQEKPGQKIPFKSDGSGDSFVWFPVKYNDRYDVVGTHKVRLILDGHIFNPVEYTVEKYLPARIVGKAMSKTDQSVTTYYNNGYCSNGTIGNRSLFYKKIRYELPNGKSFHDIVGMAMDSRGRIFAWFKDGTYGSGPPIVPATKISHYNPAFRYSLPKGKTPNDIVGMAMDPYDDVYVWFRQGTFCKGTAFNLDKLEEGYEPVWRGREPIDGMAINKAGRVLTWATGRNLPPVYVGTAKMLNRYEANVTHTIKGHTDLMIGPRYHPSPGPDQLHAPRDGY